MQGWRIHRHVQVASTNDLAGQLPGWNAVVARTQTAGRGRYRRSWVSDEGGIWLSATLPTPGPAETWSVLPLAAGWAVREALAACGVQGMRLRWPNDLMIGPAKLAGILVERFRPDAAVIGLGINYRNDPAAADPALRGLVTRLADLLTPLPAEDDVIAGVLAHCAVAQQRLAAGEVAALLPALNAAWHIGRVRVTLAAGSAPVTGAFLGVDALGNLLFRTDDGRELTLPPRQVELLREL